MSKATQRREKKFAQNLRNLAVSNPARFVHEWDTMLRYWTLEAIRRGQLLRHESTSGNTASPQLPVFGVLKKAERLLALCGPEAEQLVGARTRELLNHDCGKAFALAVDPNMYHLSVKLHKPQSEPRKKTARNDAMHELVAFDVDGTLIAEKSQHLLVWHLARSGMLSWPVLTQALWWFAKYRLRLTEDADAAMSKVLGIFAGLPASKIECLLNEFCTIKILPRLRNEAITEICRLRAAGKKVVLVSSSIDFLVQLICEHVGTDGWVATELEMSDGKLTGRISGRAVYGEEKYPALQRYADAMFGSWLLDAAYGDHDSDVGLLERAKNPIAVCPDRELKRIAGLNGWEVVIWK